ncbi:dihydrofolate reductase family protein [Brachybacterium sp. GCM10030252]|uniref:dihydrofolate reductase family protein n=1 Tax=Brachybacterium sp. GCM10030252 TaxID=3273380 RepID=UPI003619E9E1
MKLTVMQFVSLDGVSQGPGSPQEDPSGGFTRGGWLVPHMDATFVDQASDWLEHADALLLGRRTYEAFARDWPQITDPADPFAVRMNNLPKYVATQTLADGEWNPTTILTGDVEAQIAGLKAQPGRDLRVHGSSSLAQSLFSAGLVDELRLVVAPVVVGQGRRLFPDGAAPLGFELMSSRTTPQGLTIQVFETRGRPDFAAYEGVSAVG